MPHLALVTGAAKRLGRAIALGLARAGCDIAVHHNASQAEAEETAEAIRALGRKAEVVQFDQTDDAAIEKGLDRIAGVFGLSPDILINNASVSELDCANSVKRETLNRHFDTNVAGPIVIARAVVDRLQPGTTGVIINLTDHKLANPNPDHFSYTVSKFALQAATFLLADALAPRCRVCAVAPGHVLPGPGETIEHFAAIHNDTPLDVGATVDDIAAAVVFLVQASAVTGQTIIVDGGASLRRRDRDQSLTPIPEQR